MILISHRGNLSGPILERENSPSYIDEAISASFDVEVDVWYKDKCWYLGHDLPEYKIDIKWLLDREPKLWIHCKNIESLIEVKKYCLHYFWHENDTFTLTSKNYIWAYPRKNIIKESIVLLPELYNNDLDNSKGVCSDYIKKYKR
jgi:hypothetical protein